MPKRRVTVDISHSDSEDEEESSSEQQIYEDGEYDDDEDFDSLKPEASNLKMNGTSVRRKSRSQHVTFSRSKSSSKTRSNSKNFKKAAPSQSSSDESDEDSESFVQPKTQPKKQLNGKHSLLDNNNLNGSNHIDNSKSKQRNTTTSSNSTTRKGRPKQTKSSTTQDIIISSDAEEPPPMKSVPQKTKSKSKAKLLPLYNSSDGESSSKSVASSEKHSSHENGNNLPLDQSGEMVIDDNNNMESNSLEDSVDTDNSVEQHNKTMAKEKLRQGNKSGKKMNGMRVRKAVANKSNIKLTNSTSDAGPQSDKSDPPSRRTSSITKQNEDEHTNGSSSEPNNSHRASPLRISKEDVDYDNSDSETVQQQNNNNEELDDQSGEESTTVSPPPKPAAKNRTEKTKRKKVMAKKPAKKKVLVESPSPQKKRKLFDPPSNLLEDIVFEGVEDESDEEMDVSQSFSVSSQNEEMNGLSQSIKDNLVVKTDMSDAEEINSVSLKSSSELDKSQTIQLSQTNLTQVNEISTQPIPGSPSEPHRNGIMNGQTVNNTTQFKKQPSFRLQLPNMSIKVYCDDKNKS